MVSIARRLYNAVVAWVAIVLCHLPSIPYRVMCGSRLSKRRFLRRVAQPLPPPLPATRIDMGRRPLAEQSQSSRLLSLPLELRQCIYVHALGGRLVKIHLAASKYHKHYVIVSTYYQPMEDPDKILHLQRQPFADDIPVAFLLSCRQIYLEALPILHQRNTFYFLAHDFHTVAFAALGQYCLQDIRSVYLRHDSASTALSKPTSLDSQWTSVFSLLRQMRLESLIIELPAGVVVDDAEPYPHDAVLDSVWGRAVIHVRGLQCFTLFFTRGDPPLLPGFNNSLLRRLRALMTDEKADEYFASFLSGGQEGAGETAATLEAAAGRDRPALRASGHDV
ncbi:hypothetical protein B0H12DRAFT_1138444 [Mycena haematopus]|nr:hypothetical protein B0H12DRAFT_1138444 [Mycena haematopus]